MEAISFLGCGSWGGALGNVLSKKGIPVLFFFSGVHEDYHQPSDEVELIDTEKATRISKMIFYLGNEVANNPMRPEWNPDSYQEIVVEGAGR